MLRIERVSIIHPDAARLVEEVQQEYVVRYGSPDRTPLEHGVFEPPRGAFFVGYDADAPVVSPVVSGAWKLLDRAPEGAPGAPVAEIKRLYVAATHRRRGLAREMLAHLEQTASSAGAEAMVLETGEAQPEAIAMYEAAGYLRIPPFGFYRDEPTVRCYGRALGGRLPSL